ncbi:hypothetical protein HWC81_gp41 [Gordonia phage Crocheter]|uniref:Uncharacterized protein n=1 Tax=Gordonia phage Crocheter TaxID=2656532 RepID=A0A649VDI8_9CAUD|nr:hypothetical protein HWC81_gp41 [Gordonia phage Crocheter]QGJ90387.1 hypothetical protein PBI_CROCHETER_41 [Gordonia phage Crocheter]QZD97824.1 hypothetical protein SEA_NADMEG_42 [Gordonia phage Nadmeg]
MLHPTYERSTMIKKFASKHKIVLSVVAGTVTGTVLGSLARKQQQNDIHLTLTPKEVLEWLSNAGEGHITFESSRGPIRLWLIDEPKEAVDFPPQEFFDQTK